jgi:hypothetical protein
MLSLPKCLPTHCSALQPHTALRALVRHCPLAGHLASKKERYVRSNCLQNFRAAQRRFHQNFENCRANAGIGIDVAASA